MIYSNNQTEISRNNNLCHIHNIIHNRNSNVKREHNIQENWIYLHYFLHIIMNTIKNVKSHLNLNDCFENKI